MVTLLSQQLLRLGARSARLRLQVKPVRSRGCHGHSQEKPNLLRSYVQKVLDNPLPVGAGALVVGLLQWKRIRARNEALREESEDKFKVLQEEDWQVTCYKSLPLRHVSRLWGFINDVYLPVWMRTRVLGAYARAFGCDLSEAEIEELEVYTNLGDFFRRRLKSSVRPIAADDVVSPCDGTVLHCGPVDIETGLVEQVKGVTYSLSSFLGSYFTSSPHTVPGTVELVHHQTVQDEVPKQLYQMVVYLAPGDYHCFHSPVDWTIQHRRHFPGHLLSVHPKVVGLVGKLFELNERVVYLGKWKHGFFSMTAVGATNVGSIKVPADPELSTNQWKWEAKTFFQKSFQEGVVAKKGEYFGEFNLGSTIVLIFEAPPGLQFNLDAGQLVRVGKSIMAPTGDCTANPQMETQQA